MAGHIEARSMVDLKELADDPPRYPINPASVPREALVLYISRVPGSRDVILSPLRPQAKNVTGGDVLHSLYYVHLDQPSDEQRAVTKPAIERSFQTTIPRKPLPRSAKASTLENNSIADPDVPSHPVAPQPVHHNVPSLQIPVLGQPETVYDAPTSLPPGPVHSFQPPTTAKPLGPRPIGSEPAQARDDHVSIASPPRVPLSVHAVPNRQQGQTGDITPWPSTSDSSHHRAVPFPLLRSLSPAKPQYRPAFTSYTLTLIRRDPASGDQKNVARITSFQTSIPTPDMADQTLAPDNMPRPKPPEIHIRIETLGYAKFGNWPTRAALDKFAAEGNLNLKPGETFVDGPGRRSRGTSFNLPAPDKQGFNREVKMAYTKTWTSNIKSAFHMRQKSNSMSNGRLPSETNEQQHAADSFVPPRAPAMQSHRRQNSAESAGSAESLGSWPGRPTSSSGMQIGRSSMGDVSGKSPTAPASPLITQAGPGLKPKGYVFASPWDGRCEFRTGRGGRSLECRHVLGSSNAGFETANEGHGATGSKSVSELRFNLPASLGGRISSNSHVGGRRSFHGKFDRLLKLDGRHRDDSSDDDDEEEEEEEDDVALDLSLGRERAGGGSKGNRAKLGKLILHDEGQKMMDLVVAANIGVWWATWERSST